LSGSNGSSGPGGGGAVNANGSANTGGGAGANDNTSVPSVDTLGGSGRVIIRWLT
jgi:hypothetical protein